MVAPSKAKVPSARVLRRLLSYDPATGDLMWRSRPLWMFKGSTPGYRRRAWTAWTKRYANQPAFKTVSNQGYLVSTLFNQTFTAHRIIYCLQTGEWSSTEIDHINGNRADNRWCNLRAVSKTDQQRNMCRSRRNTSGQTGVYWSKAARKWAARIGSKSGSIHLGLYDTLEGATLARKQAEQELGYHKNHGRVA